MLGTPTDDGEENLHLLDSLGRDCQGAPERTSCPICRTRNE